MPFAGNRPCFYNLFTILPSPCGEPTAWPGGPWLRSFYCGNGRTRIANCQRPKIRPHRLYGLSRGQPRMRARRTRKPDAGRDTRREPCAISNRNHGPRFPCAGHPWRGLSLLMLRAGPGDAGHSIASPARHSGGKRDWRKRMAHGMAWRHGMATGKGRASPKRAQHLNALCDGRNYFFVLACSLCAF